MKFYEKEDLPRIEVVPIVDVLLAVFLFLAVLAFSGKQLISIMVSLPQVQEKGKANLNLLNIEITKNGTIIVDRKAVSLEDLQEYLNSNKTLVNILADKETPYKFIAQVLALLQKKKISAVNLILQSTP